MPGIIYRVIPKTSYDLSSLNTHNANLSYTLAKGINVASYREGTLVVRIHSFNQTSVGGPTTDIRVQFQVLNDGPTDDDPDADFNENTTLATTGNVSLSSITAPYLNLAAFNSNLAMGSYLRVLFYSQQFGTPGTPPNVICSVVVSVDIVAKSGPAQ